MGDRDLRRPVRPTRFHSSNFARRALRGEPALRTGTTVRTGSRPNKTTRVSNGAHAESREELGGYFIIEVATLDEALLWASRVPSAARGAVEVRASYPAPTMMR